MTFYGRSVIWSTALWIMVFLFSYMTYTGASVTARLAPLVGLFIMLSMALLLLAQKANETKTILWLGAWALALNIGVILSTLDVLDDTFLTIYISVSLPHLHHLCGALLEMQIVYLNLVGIGMSGL